jgi:hypothetical protein
MTSGGIRHNDDPAGKLRSLTKLGGFIRLKAGVFEEVTGRDLEDN